MFKDDYKNELNNITLSDEFKRKTIALMEKRSAELENSRSISFPIKKISQIAAVFILCAVTAYSSGIFKAFNKSDIDSAPLQLRRSRDDKSAKITEIAEDSSHSGSNFCIFCDMVVVDGVNYWRTADTNDNARCGMMDGYITSSVESGKLRTENDQSNFGTGYGYQYGQEYGTIEVNIDGVWVVFSTLEEDE